MHACLLACFVSVYIICLFVTNFVFKENQSTGMIVEFRDLLSSRWLRMSDEKCYVFFFGFWLCETFSRLEFS
jgi:hypothetical protein